MLSMVMLNMIMDNIGCWLVITTRYTSHLIPRSLRIIYGQNNSNIPWTMLREKNSQISLIRKTRIYSQSYTIHHRSFLLFCGLGSGTPIVPFIGILGWVHPSLGEAYNMILLVASSLKIGNHFIEKACFSRNYPT